MGLHRFLHFSGNLTNLSHFLQKIGKNNTMMVYTTFDWILSVDLVSFWSVEYTEHFKWYIMYKNMVVIWTQKYYFVQKCKKSHKFQHHHFSINYWEVNFSKYSVFYKCVLGARSFLFIYLEGDVEIVKICRLAHKKVRSLIPMSQWANFIKCLQY